MCDDKAVETTPELEAWQAEHEPLLTIRVWDNYDGPGLEAQEGHARGMVSIRWEEAVAALEPLDKPHMRMLGAMEQAARHLQNVAAALLTVIAATQIAPTRES